VCLNRNDLLFIGVEMLKTMFERIRVAYRVLFDGEEVFYEEVRRRLKQNRDIEYLKMMETVRLATQERDLAVQTMKLVANESLQAITLLEKDIAKFKQQQQDPFDGLLSMHRTTKDDLPN